MDTNPSSSLRTGVLYYGDNLDVLRRHIPDESIDLIYLDPPFNSQATYNVLFREESGAGSHAQIEAFEDTWHWGDATAQAYDEVIHGPNQQVARMLRAMVDGLGHNQVTAYLAMMATRLVELHRILKPTGSIYLHCDPTASHYLKILIDAVFGPRNFRNEIIWKRTTAHSSAKRYAPIHDVLFYYGKSGTVAWNGPRADYEEAYLDKYYRFDDGDGRLYWRADITGAGTVKTGETGKPWRGHDPARIGRHWVRPPAELDKMDAEGHIYWPKDGGMPQMKRYRDELKGKAAPDIWDDVNRINPVGNERLGYPTQKPLALLERIITASSNPGDIVLDPFCGCGTAVHAAQKLGRRWIGIDVTFLAINLIEARMKGAFRDLEIKVIGEPVDLTSARDLARRSKRQFELWALMRLGAQPSGKKGADKGIDGIIPIWTGGTAQKPEYSRAIVSVKGGDHVSSPMIRDLKGVLDREGEPLGILLTLNPPTREMVTEAAASGFYENDFWKKRYPRVQILTVLEVLNGKRPDMPWGGSPFAKAPVEREQGETERLL